MNKTALAKKIRKLTAAADRENFIFDLLLAYGLPKSRVTLLRNSDTNYLNVGGELSLKRQLFFRHLQPDDEPLSVRDNIRENSITAKQRFIVLTDYHRFYGYDTQLDEALDCEFAELADHYDFFLPWAGIEKTRHYDENPADVKAAGKMAKLFDLIKKENPDNSPEFVHDLNVFLSRILFCFFAEDTQIFPGDNIFTNGIGSQTAADGHDLKDYLTELFTLLDQTTAQRGNPRAHFRDFPYVNGGLFRDRIQVPEFSARSRRAIIDAGSLDWGDINPDIFGSMIQAVVTAEHRGGLGMHYTSVPNIMKVIEPLFLNDLREAFTNARDSRTEHHRLVELRKRISKLKIFDPACGSGNFLIIAYKELRKLEMAIIQRLDELGDFIEARLFEKGAGAVSTITLQQFYGIEIDDFAHEIAILALWLAEHQMNTEFARVFGRSKPTLPLEDAGNIVHANACRVDWEEVCPKVEGDETYILGNPPYLGFSVQDKEQKNDMRSILGSSSKLDYIAVWFLKASLFNNGNSDFAFVSTNSICQGEQVGLLWPIILNAGLQIIFCVKDFKWDNNAKSNAAVICSIIGVGKGENKVKKIYLNDRMLECKSITPYLAPGRHDIIVEKRKSPISTFEPMVLGNMAKDGGGLFLTNEEKEEVVQKFPALNSLIRKASGSFEFINDTPLYCLWIKDEDLPTALVNPFVAERINRVKEMRLNSIKKATREFGKTPHRFVEIRHQETNSIIVPRVSSERRFYLPIGYLEPNVIVKDSAYAVYNAKPYMFGLLASSMQIVWLKTTGGKLKLDYRYSSQLVYNTFPFPPITPAQEASLTETALGVLSAREQHPGSTLADLYDPDKMPENLRAAHRANDLAVEACYRPEPFVSDEERLAYLFKLYEEMIAAERERDTLFADGKKGKKARKKK